MANRDYVLDTNIVSALIDLLIGAVATRLNGVLVTDDRDFQYLPIQTENWLRDT